MRVFLMNRVPTWIVDGLAREGWRGQVVDEPAQVPVDAALVLVGEPDRALVLAVHHRAPEAAVVGCGAAAEATAELIAVGVDDLLPMAPPVDAATRLALIAQRALRRPAGVSAFGDVLELVLFRASAATGDVQFVNDAAFRAGLATADHVGAGSGWRAAIHPDDLDEVDRRRRDALAGAPQSFVHRFIARDGGQRWVRASLRRVGDSLFGSLLDITAERDLERSLSLIAYEWRAILDSVPLGVILFDDRRRIVRLNAAALEVFGTSFAELVDAPLDDFMAWQPWATAAPLVAQVLAGASTASAVSHPEPDGRAWSLSVTPLRADLGGERRAILLVREVTDDLRLRRTAEQNERMASVGSVVAGVAHEVRNPLFGISAIADALEMRLKDLGEPLPHLQMLRVVVARLAKLMNELLVLGSTARLEREPLVVGEVLEEARQAVAHLAGERQVTVDLAAPPHPVIAAADRSQLAQVVQNLLDNAIRHAPAGSVVTGAAVALDGGRVHITVRDRGPGFGPHRARALEPFYSRRKDGTGLGLAIVQQIAQRHGGTVSLSDHPDGGALVTVELPAEGPT
jgi:PAS domain S-box-containing protein